eukprot:TRINITY_DN1831_c0_g1_i1.p1 TRINITY_DN1831_c0_g1~~TRINITY_DN1831_c0_g1_i1.p1  ORF type:complete len:805 (-),score=165.60 TRINITY_DN1831_c0_g1_i1:3-2351(-)
MMWHYLDHSGQEQGPFSAEQMRAAFASGQLPNSLMVRLSSWAGHFPISTVYPDHTSAFVGMPQLPQQKEPPQQSPAGMAGMGNMYPSQQNQAGMAALSNMPSQQQSQEGMGAMSNMSPQQQNQSGMAGMGNMYPSQQYQAGISGMGNMSSQQQNQAGMAAMGNMSSQQQNHAGMAGMGNMYPSQQNQAGMGNMQSQQQNQAAMASMGNMYPSQQNHAGMAAMSNMPPQQQNQSGMAGMSNMYTSQQNHAGMTAMNNVPSQQHNFSGMAGMGNMYPPHQNQAAMGNMYPSQQNQPGMGAMSNMSPQQQNQSGMAGMGNMYPSQQTQAGMAGMGNMSPQQQSFSGMPVMGNMQYQQHNPAGMAALSNMPHQQQNHPGMAGMGNMYPQQTPAGMTAKGYGKGGDGGKGGKSWNGKKGGSRQQKGRSRSPRRAKSPPGKPAAVALPVGRQDGTVPAPAANGNDAATQPAASTPGSTAAPAKVGALPAVESTAGPTARELSDQKEAAAKAAREANAEPTREEKPLELLKDRCPTEIRWQDGIVDVHNRSWMFLAHEPSITWNDFTELQQKVDWRNLTSGAGGKVTRKTMWYTLKGCTCPYRYGQELVPPQDFPDWFDSMMRRWLSKLRLDEAEYGYPNAANLNYYENGEHAVAWHADDEPLFNGKNQDTRIISISLGSTRKFQVGFTAPRRGGILQPEKGSKQSFQLGHGMLSTMEGMFQKHYLHQIDKAGSTTQPRINVTFRWIVHHQRPCELAPANPVTAAPDSKKAKKGQGGGRGWDWNWMFGW